MYVYSVAWRHLKTRSISWVAILLIAAVVCLYLLIISVLEGFKAHYMDKLQGVLAHSTISVGDLAWGIQRPEKWAGEIEQLDPGIRGVTIGLETPAMAIFDQYRTIGTLRGIDFEREMKHGRLKDMLKVTESSPDGKGTMLVPAGDRIKEFGTHMQGGKELPGCIAGGAWRKSYGLKVGDRVTFVFTSEETDKEDGVPRSIAFAIIGFFETENPYLETGAYVDRKFLAKEMNCAGLAKTLYVWLKEPNRADLDALKARMKSTIQAAIVREGNEYADHVQMVQVETWKEKDNKFYEAITRENLMMRVIMGIFLALVAFIVFLIFGRLVAEKIRDIGALRAMGATPAGICACFLVQGLFLGSLGLIVGLWKSFLVINNINSLADFIFWLLGIRIFPTDSFGVDAIPAVTLPIDVVVISVLTILAAVLGALLPAWRAARLNPVECLRHE
ncbi:MAG TPA: FtsX-like permease family protein [Planctomycetota bacterium]|nr:FtsX-like permease family protein [Planctomycetota bacterium]